MSQTPQIAVHSLGLDFLGESLTNYCQKAPQRRFLSGLGMGAEEGSSRDLSGGRLSTSSETSRLAGRAAHAAQKPETLSIS